MHARSRATTTKSLTEYAKLTDDVLIQSECVYRGLSRTMEKLRVMTTQGHITYCELLQAYLLEHVLEEKDSLRMFREDSYDMPSCHSHVVGKPAEVIV
jgi:hypothetical protein